MYNTKYNKYQYLMQNTINVQTTTNISYCYCSNMLIKPSIQSVCCLPSVESVPGWNKKSAGRTNLFKQIQLKKNYLRNVMEHHGTSKHLSMPLSHLKLANCCGSAARLQISTFPGGTQSAPVAAAAEENGDPVLLGSMRKPRLKIGISPKQSLGYEKDQFFIVLLETCFKHVQTLSNRTSKLQALPGSTS